MYDAITDPYCYPGTTVLKNIPGIKTARALVRFEAIATAARAEEPLPRGRLGATHYRAVHRHLFQDVYAWAGRYRTVRISKAGSAFCYPEYIARGMSALFFGLKKKRFLRRLSKDEFAREAAKFLSTLNAIHPFREGNGRAQTAFLVLLAAHANHPLNIAKLNAKSFMAAMIESFQASDAALAKQIARLVD
ncbi:MAG: Fic family protein [Alphaproteobacteria bacterium]|nr:Fic family protein [Alphaproteobacteria bacterium]MDE2112006.1 Fic family protein [Alphaproteobacteria bacterium]MDE2492336.1 Fic family protein [Alphaproteobacteria bacterium]